MCRGSENLKTEKVLIAVIITLVLVIAGLGFYSYQQYSNLQVLRSEYSALKEGYAGLQSDYASLQQDYSSLDSNYSALQLEHDTLVLEYNALSALYQELKSEHELYDTIFSKAEIGYIASTIVYYTDYGNELHIISVFIANSTFYYYRNAPHPYYNNDPTYYVTASETVVISIVKTIQGHTSEEEELADALLSSAQDQGISLSIQYWLEEAKYPVETLVQGGGNCKAHTILYASLLKAAGYKLVILITEDQAHTLVGVHLTSPPRHNTQESYWYITYNEEHYYFAETTCYGWMVGDLPSEYQGQSFYIYPVD